MAAHMEVSQSRVLGIVLAGGAGKRLAPLTADRAKPAVPFGGLYRLVDFALSNLVNSGMRRICVLTQYKSHSLDRHITTTWRLSSLLGNYVTPVPAQQRLGPHWYTGSADAIYQSLNLIFDDQPDIVAVFGADHVFRMDPQQMIDQHVARGAGVTVAAIPVPREEATAFGVIQVGPDGRTIDAFLEKPADPPAMPGHPDDGVRLDGHLRLHQPTCWSTRCARTRPTTAAGTTWAGTSSRCWSDRRRPRSTTSWTTRCPARRSATPGTGATSGRSTPTSTRTWTCARCTRCSTCTTTGGRSSPHVPSQPPAKFVHDSGDRVGRAINSVVSNGVIVSGGLVRNSVLSPGRPGQQLVPGGAGGDAAQHQDRPARGGRERDPGQERRRPRGRRDRRRQGTRPGPRVRRSPRRHHGGRQGPGRCRCDRRRPASSRSAWRC